MQNHRWRQLWFCLKPLNHFVPRLSAVYHDRHFHAYRKFELIIKRPQLLRLRRIVPMVVQTDFSDSDHLRMAAQFFDARKRGGIVVR